MKTQLPFLQVWCFVEHWYIIPKLFFPLQYLATEHKQLKSFYFCIYWLEIYIWILYFGLLALKCTCSDIDNHQEHFPLWGNFINLSDVGINNDISVTSNVGKHTVSGSINFLPAILFECILYCQPQGLQFQSVIELALSWTLYEAMPRIWCREHEWMKYWKADELSCLFQHLFSELLK